MRRFAFVVAALVAPLFAAAGCEDGPNQPYSPAGASAGGWNGNSGQGGLDPDGGYVGNGTQGYDASFGGTNANDLCTAPQEKMVWGNFFSMPIAPPGLGGGVDMAGGIKGDGSAGYVPGKPFTYDPTKETWKGTTVEQVEKFLCQGTAVQYFIGITNQLAWGENNEFSVIYNTSNRAVQYMFFTYGYNGTADATSVDGKTKYSISLNNVPITKTTSSGPTQLIFNWNDPVGFPAMINEMYDAYRNTYAPTFPPDKDCIAAGHCVTQNNLSNGGNITFVPLNLTFYVQTTVGTPQANSIPQILQLGLLKLLPFSNASTLMKLDAEGPFFQATNVGNTGKTCKYTLGMKFSDFDANCVEPFPSGNVQNQIATAKLYGGMSHANETFGFDISGVDPQFAAALPPNQVVADGQKPGPGDIAYELGVDGNDIGLLANDYTNNDTTQAQDWHGSGMVTLEWANLVQQYMKKIGVANTNLGDAACIANPVSPGGGKLCSGIEGIITSAPPSLAPATMAFNAIGPKAIQIDPALAVGIKPNTWYSVFCSTGYQNCIGGRHGGIPNAGYFFDTMQYMVAQALGNRITPQLTDRRFYFKEWILAAVKYFQSAGNPAATLATIDANPIDADDLFFDSDGQGGEYGQYVFRQFVNSAQQPPTVFSVDVNLLTSGIGLIYFDRYNLRGEKALYSLLKTNNTDLPGAEPLLLTNIVGSSLLPAQFGTYACAINTDPHNQSCGYNPQTGQPAVTGPVDELGQPILTPYQNAFGQSAFHIAGNGQPEANAPLKVDTTDYALIQSANVSIPQWPNPYDPTTAKPTDPPVQTLLTFVPLGADTGFPVTIDGSRDKFYNTNTIDFTGLSVNGNLDYDTPTIATAGGGTQTTTVVRAIETQNYLGLIFPCAEANPVTGKVDVLGVRMYDNAQAILTWLAKYPTATTDCGIQIKYSIYGNYPDYISSLTYGVRFGLNPGFGGSVVSDGTLFDPNVVSTLGQ